MRKTPSSGRKLYCPKKLRNGVLMILGPSADRAKPLILPGADPGVDLVAKPSLLQFVQQPAQAAKYPTGIIRVRCR